MEDAIRMFKDKSDGTFADDLAGLERELTDANKGYNRGLLDFNEVNKVKSKVSFALLDYLNQL